MNTRVEKQSSEDKYLKSLRFKIKNFIENARNKYGELKNKSSRITSYYDFNLEVDELGDLIEYILFLKKHIAKLEQAASYDETSFRRMTDEEKSQQRYKQLLGDKKIIVEQMKTIDQVIAKLKDETLLYRLSSKLEMERFRLGTDLGIINSSLRIYESNPDLTDNEIDIYIKGNDHEIQFQGTIYLHGTGIEIGTIEYRGPVESKWLGDIGYNISEKYRGHNYAYKALELISTLIASKGIDKVTITVYKDNTPSIKTIEKFGGVLTSEPQSDVLSYTCSIKQTLEQTSKKV